MKMNDLIEIILEDINIESIDILFSILVKKDERIKNIIYDDLHSEECLRTLILSGRTSELFKSSEFALIVNLHEVVFNSLIAKNVMIRVICYGDKYDMELNFYQSDLNIRSIITIKNYLRDFFLEIQNKINSSGCYVGYESADEKTNLLF